MTEQRSQQPRRTLGNTLEKMLVGNRPASAALEAPRAGITRIPIEQIRADPDQPRKHFAPEHLEELSRSIKTQGLLQPVLVRRDGKEYRLIAGERRWRAAQLAGLQELPAVIRESNATEAFELALVENLQREDLTPLEAAEGYRRLMESRRWTQEQVADRVGKERSTVANALRLLSLPNEVKQMVEQGQLDMGHARALLGVTRVNELVALARATVAEGLSVRAVEARVKAAKSPSKKSKPKESPEAKKLVEDLQRRLGARVRLNDRGGKGTLEVDYVSYEDLERIVGMIKR